MSVVARALECSLLHGDELLDLAGTSWPEVRSIDSGGLGSVGIELSLPDMLEALVVDLIERYSQSSEIHDEAEAIKAEK